MTDYTELKRLAEAAQDKQLGTLTIPVSVVLSMIAEIDRLRLHIKHIGNDALRTQNQALVEALKRIVFTVPALDGAGGLFFEHHGFDGEYLGVEQIDPMWVIQKMAEVAQSALAQAEGGV